MLVIFFLDWMNSSNVVKSMISSTQPPNADAKERKRQRDNERYARKNDEILKKQREAYQRKKSEAALVDANKHQMASGKSKFLELGCWQSAEGIAQIQMQLSRLSFIFTYMNLCFVYDVITIRNYITESTLMQGITKTLLL